MTKEQTVRAYGAHLGLITRARDDVFVLSERYGKKRTIGRYRSISGLERGIERYGDRTLRELERDWGSTPIPKRARCSVSVRPDGSTARLPRIPPHVWRLDASSCWT
jgi:hypothetical protein